MKSHSGNYEYVRRYVSRFYQIKCIHEYSLTTRICTEDPFFIQVLQLASATRLFSLKNILRQPLERIIPKQSH